MQCKYKYPQQWSEEPLQDFPVEQWLPCSFYPTPCSDSDKTIIGNQTKVVMKMLWITIMVNLENFDGGFVDTK